MFKATEREGGKVSKVSRRPGREEIKEIKKKKKRAEKALRARQKAEGLKVPFKAAIPNRKCEYKSVEEEQKARRDATTEQVRVFRAKLPLLLKRLSRIKDPRNPKKIKHKHILLMIYGILTFVFQMSSRREANREMTRPMFMENLKLLFPELEDLPHNATLMRLLARIDVQEIESTLIELVRKLIRDKKFFGIWLINVILLLSMVPKNVFGACFGARNVWSVKWGKGKIAKCNIACMCWRPILHLTVA
jgi:hypothetical protein